MADSYLAISQIAADPHMAERVRSCYAQQTGDDPVQWTFDNRYQWVGPGWGSAWESALANGIEEPGLDPSVISDEQILSQVQSMLSEGESHGSGN